MDERLVRYFDDKKFMWDGKEYETEQEAKDKEQEYGQDDFRVKIVQDESSWLVYTRRVVSEAKT